MKELTVNERIEWLKNNKPEEYVEQLGLTWEDNVDINIKHDLYSFHFNHPFYGGYSGMSA